MPKINEVMPVLITRFVADTVQLSGEQTGAYMLALLHQWSTGPLPNDMGACARIMRLSGRNAPQQAASLLQRFFVQLADGGWINLRNAAIRGEREMEAKRYSERGRKANEIRWAGHTRKWPDRSLSGAQKREQGIQEGIQKLVRELPDAAKPGKKRKNTGKIAPQSHKKTLSKDSNKESNKESRIAMPRDLVLELPLRRNLSNVLRPFGKKALAATPKKEKFSASIERQTEEPKAKAKRKALKPAPSASPKAASLQRTTRPLNVEPTPKPVRISVEKTATSNPFKTEKRIDPRFARFRQEFFTFWRANHPNDENHPWNSSDGSSLNRLLRSNPSLTLKGFGRLLQNRVESDDVNLSESPARWLHQLMRFGSGPLDKYNKVKRSALK